MELDLEEMLQSALAAYRATLVSVGEVGVQACPPVGEGFEQSLANLSQRLVATSSSALLRETEQDVEQELRAWGTRASQYHEQKLAEVRSVLLLVAKAATEVGTRDQRYATELANLAERLHDAAELDNLSAMRQSLSRNATALQSCVTQMTKDSQETIAQLRGQVAAHETRLAEVEHLAFIDQLTGLPNRRRMEREIDLRCGTAFNVMFLDINNFKQVNDTLGHSAGDDLLKQFAVELRGALRSADTVGRWGGDEFVVLVDGNPQAAERRVRSAQEWVNGRYTLATEEGSQQVEIQAAIGIASWQPGDTVTSLLQRADGAMYQHKRSTRQKVS